MLSHAPKLRTPPVQLAGFSSHIEKVVFPEFGLPQTQKMRLRSGCSLRKLKSKLSQGRSSNCGYPGFQRGVGVGPARRTCSPLWTGPTLARSPPSRINRVNAASTLEVLASSNKSCDDDGAERGGESGSWKSFENSGARSLNKYWNALYL